MRLHMQLHLSLEPHGVKGENEINWKSLLRHSGPDVGKHTPFIPPGAERNLSQVNAAVTLN
jgi:hypothetical protein